MANRNESGSALILVFIACGLFAALCYTFMRNSSNTGMFSQQKAQLIATEILDILQKRAKAYSTLQGRGCGEQQIDMGSSSARVRDGDKSGEGVGQDAQQNKTEDEEQDRAEHHHHHRTSSL